MRQPSKVEVEEVRQRLRWDTVYWAEHCARILDKRKQLVPLVAKPWQVELDEALEAQRAADKPMRAIVLKARKLGFSTWVAAKFLQRLTQLPDQQAIIVAQDVKTAGQIFEIAKRIHAHLPTYEQLGMGFSIRPDITGASFSPNGRKFVSFGDRVRRGIGDSLLEIDTANAPEAGRGYTPSLLHLSEVARWPERATSGPQSKMLAVLNAVPHVEETIVVQESTANGLNHFYRRWISARDGAQDADTGETYVPIFVPWWRDPECAMAFENPAQRERFIEGIGDTKKHGQIAEDEPALIELYATSPEQLFWRRMMIRTQHEEKVELFKQENPSSDEEAFISSGRPYFSGILVAKAIKAAEAAPEPVLGTLIGTGWTEKKTRGGKIMVPSGAKWVPAGEAQRGMPWSKVPGAEGGVESEPPLLEVWEHPVTAESQELLPASERQPAGAYVVTVDPAEGEADTFDVGDFHAVQVFDHRSRQQVAQYESRVDRHLLPLWVVLVGLYYNVGWLAIEVNSVGMAVQDPVKNDYRYKRLYRRRRYDSARNLVADKAGWKTSPETKPMIEDAYGSLLQSDVRGGLRSVRAARQLTTYVQDERGRRGAMPGENDDLLMATMIAARIMEELKPPSDGKARRVRGRELADPLTGY